MGGAAIAFLSGLGAGYLSQSEKDKDRERQTKLDQVTLDRADRETKTYNREEKDRDALRAAGSPVTVNSNAAMLGTSGQPTLYEDAGVAGSDFRQARNMASQTGAEFTDQAPTPAVSVAGKQYDNLASAQGAANTANTPEARTQRVMAAVSGIDPIKALDLENQQVTRTREDFRFTQEQGAYAKKLQDEGAIAALKALRGGDGVGMVAAFNKSGQYKILGEPVITPETREIRGLGAIPTYSATFKVQGADGKITETKVNSHDMGMSLMPYEKWYDEQLKTSKEGREGKKVDMVFEETKRHNQATERNGEVTANAAATKAAAAAGAAGGKPLNDTQSKALLFGSRMRESDEILNKLAMAGTTTSLPGARGSLSGVINMLAPENKQMLEQAKRDFTNAVLRRESGAVIADTEFANADKQYFPQIGDSPKTIEQKSKNRKLALDGILLEVPESHRNSLQPRSAPNALAAIPKDKAALQSGQTYQTSRGPAKWNGTAFEAQ